MKKDLIKNLLVSVMFLSILSCASFKSESSDAEAAICPVCKMKVNTSEGYQLKLNGVMYYFDDVDCKKVFKMNPERFDDRTAKKGQGVL